MIIISGQGLPHYMYEKNVTIENDHRDDPNELVDRLRLLVSKREAGNTNYDYEIKSIIDKLRQAKVIF